MYSFVTFSSTCIRGSFCLSGVSGVLVYWRWLATWRIPVWKSAEHVLRLFMMSCWERCCIILSRTVYLYWFLRAFNDGYLILFNFPFKKITILKSHSFWVWYRFFIFNIAKYIYIIYIYIVMDNYPFTDDLRWFTYLSNMVIFHSYVELEKSPWKPPFVDGSLLILA